MRLLISGLAAAGSIALYAACGPPALTCDTQACSGSAHTYQVCLNSDSSSTYKLGGSSCTCSGASCQSCATQVANYCGNGSAGTGGSGGSAGAGGSAGTGGASGAGGSRGIGGSSGKGGSRGTGGAAGTSGSGGTTGSGGTSGSSGGTCSVTLSGAVTGTFACTAFGTYAMSSNLGGVTLAVSMPSPLAMITAAIEKPGMPATGTWTSSDSGGKSALVVQRSGTPPSTWDATLGTTSDQGTYVMNANFSGGGPLYKVSGTVTATLPAVAGTGSTGTVSLSATF
jgi:hypothetical protein